MTGMSWLRGVAFLLVAAFLSGCGDSGPKRNRVFGTVSYQGQPLKAGQILFILKGDQAPSGGAPIHDGKYELPASRGLFAGAYKVSISAPDGKAVPEGEMPGITTTPKETLPARYNAQTELEREVKDGEKNEFNFELQ
jgi:hypothetical protein